eukprot:UN16383
MMFELSNARSITITRLRIQSNCTISCMEIRRLCIFGIFQIFSNLDQDNTR